MDTAPNVEDSVDSGHSGTCLPEAFFRHILAHNPFTLNRASADGSEGPDVVQIHSDVFSRLTELAGEAVRLRRGLGVLLASEAGSGKSHIFGRLARWSAVGERACYVVVRGLQTDPELLPAAILRSAGSALAGRAGAKPVRTPLYRLAHHAARIALNDKQERYSWDRVGRAFAKLADRFAPAARRVSEGRAAFDLIFRFFRSAARSMDGKEQGETAELVLRWLTGGMLDAREARRLHLPPARHRDDPVTLTDPEWSRQGLTALSVLAAATGRPLILVIDQAEELDSARFQALARFLNGLLDQAPGLLAVTAAETGAVLSWRDRGVVPQSAWDRLGQFTLEAARLKPAEGVGLVRKRLDHALAPFREVEFLYRLRADAPLFPLHLELNDCGVWARDALEAARVAWSTEQEVLRREGGASWLSGWAERVARSAEKNNKSEQEAESSLTREQVQAAIAVRTKPSGSSPELAIPPAPPTVAEQAPDESSTDAPNESLESPTEEPKSETDIVSSLTSDQLQAAIAQRMLPEAEEEPSDTLTEIPVGGEPSLTNDQLRAAAAWRSQRNSSDTEDTELSLSAEQVRAAMAHVIARDDPEPEEPAAPPTVAEAPPPTATHATSMADFCLPDELDAEPKPSGTNEEVLADPPTVPDPNAARPRRASATPPVSTAASPAAADPRSLAFAPSDRQQVLTPRAWPPSAPAPTPRDEAVDLAVAASIGDYLTARASRRELPADAEQVAELILNLLQQCHTADAGYGVLQAERVPSWKATPTACDLVVRQQAREDVSLRTGVLVLTGNRATAIAGYLRRLTTESQPFDRLFLITEERVGLPLGPRGLEYLQELQQRTSVQLHTLELTIEDHSELSALRATVRLSRSGSLVADGGRVSEIEVITSHHRQQRYLASRFLSAILFDAPPTELLRRSTSMSQ
jgi:hypothetical protein